MKYLSLSLLLFVHTFSWAQKLTLQGTLKDSLNSPLEFATVMLLNAKDSSLVMFDRSNTQGFFELKNINPSNYLLKITFIGFVPFTQKIDEQSSGVVNLGNITMKIMSKQLKDIVVEGEKAPVTIKQDTIEFNAESFKTKPNASVEDLLKKLPGVEVEKDGTVKAQGETVQRVTVNGKEFFGRDPKLATKNLPAMAVDKVQVFDQKSDQATFSGIDDGQREKTINIELKEKYKKGMFGNLMAGAGTDERYESRLSLNRFTKTNQLSLLGMANNVNQQGFSIDDYLNFSGDIQRMMGGRGGGGTVRMSFGGNNSSGIPLNFGGQVNGIMKTIAGGVNFNQTFNPKTELNGSYFYNHLDHLVKQDVLRQNFIPTGSFNSNESTLQNNQNNNHRVNWTLEHKLDSANSLKWNASLAYNQTQASTESENQNFNTDNVLQNEGNRLSISEGDRWNFNSNLLFRHRFRKKGRTISANFTLGINQNQSEGTLEATNIFYEQITVTQNINQRNTQDNKTYNYSTNLSYTEPLGKRKYLEVNYNFSQNRNKVNREVFDLVNENEVLNEDLSNRFNSNFTYHRGGLNFRWNRKKSNFSTGVSVQNARLIGDLLIQDIQINRSFTNLLPNLRYNYEFSNSKRLNFEYETNVNEPSIQQLQPIVDNSDPLNISLGNPNLRPAYLHNLSLRFTTFDPIKFVNFFATISSTYTTNAISNATSISERLVRITQPVNVRENLNLRGNFNFGFPIKKIGSRINIGPTLSYNKGINIINDVENDTHQQTIGGNVRYNFRHKEWLDLSLIANLSYQKTEYESNAAQNQLFFNQTYSSELILTLPYGLNFSSDFDYLIYQSQTTDFTQKIPLLNLSFSKFLLKGQAGELKISVVNLLDRNINANQTVNINYLEQSVTESLGRYFMLSFTYALNKAMNPTAGNRRGMMRFIQR